jgi:hypothetical protein
LYRPAKPGEVSAQAKCNGDGHVELCSKFDPARMTFNPRRTEDHDHVTPN